MNKGTGKNIKLPSSRFTVYCNMIIRDEAICQYNFGNDGKLTEIMGQ